MDGGCTSVESRLGADKGGPPKEDFWRWGGSAATVHKASSHPPALQHLPFSMISPSYGLSPRAPSSPPSDGLSQCPAPPPSPHQEGSHLSGPERDRMRVAVIDEASIVCSTLSFAGSAMFYRMTRKFDVVIIDEVRGTSYLGLCMCVPPPLLPSLMSSSSMR